MKKVYKYIILPAAALLCANAAAQNGHTEFFPAGGDIFAVGQTKIADAHYSSAISSGLMLGSRMLYSDLSLNAGFERGDYRRPQQPGEGNRYNFSTEGAALLGSFYAVGGFDFTQAYDNDVRYNSLFDPFRGTPYNIADSTGGDWRKQSYSLWTRIASPFVADRVSFGLRLDLNVNRGAKQIDPRPQAVTNKVAVSPSVTLRLDNRNAIGAGFDYARFRETTNFILYDTRVQQKLYMLKGMGQYAFKNFTTTEYERKYAGDQFGAALNYSFTGRRLSLLAEGRYSNYVEDATNMDNNKPNLVGRFFDITANADLSAVYVSARSLHYLKGGYERRERTGREIIQIFNPSSEVNAWEFISEAPRRSVVMTTDWRALYGIMLSKNAGGVYLWNLSLGGALSDFSETYRVMDSYLEYKSSTASLTAERIFPFRSFSLMAGLEGAYRMVLGESMSYVMREADDATIRDGLILPEYEILTSGYYSGGLTLTGVYRLKGGSGIRLQGRFTRLKSETGLTRAYYGASLGYTF